MDPRISIVTLGVDDLDRSREFYRDGLGLPERDTDGNIAFYELQGAWLALYPWDELADDATVAPDGLGFRGVTIAHNAESKDAVDDVIQEAKTPAPPSSKAPRTPSGAAIRDISRTPTTISGGSRGTRTGSSKTNELSDIRRIAPSTNM